MAMTLLLLLTLFFIVLYGQILQLSRCVKSVRIRSYSGLHFPALRLNRGIAPYSVRMWKNTDQYNSEHKHFSRSASVSILCIKSFSSQYESFPIPLAKRHCVVSI